VEQSVSLVALFQTKEDQRCHYSSEEYRKQRHHVLQINLKSCLARFSDPRFERLGKLQTFQESKSPQILQAGTKQNENYKWEIWKLVMQALDHFHNGPLYPWRS
jgi:hypothetical protein